MQFPNRVTGIAGPTGKGIVNNYMKLSMYRALWAYLLYSVYSRL